MEPPGRRRGQGGAPAAKRGRTTLAGPGTGRYWQAENQGTWSGCLLPALGEQLLVGDRRHPLAGRVPPVVVVVLDPGRDRGAGLGVDWQMPIRWQAARNRPAVYSPP